MIVSLSRVPRKWRNIGLLAVFGCWGALAADQTATDVIAGRRSNLRDLGSAYKELGEELKKSKPLPFLLQQYIGEISDFSQQQQNWFPPNTGPKTGIETHAKEEIWTKPQEFTAAMQAFQKEAAVLTGISTSDLDALKVEHKKLGLTCKNCHDTFREKED
jgi:cytochrome c556